MTMIARTQNTKQKMLDSDGFSIEELSESDFSEDVKKKKGNKKR